MLRPGTAGPACPSGAAGSTEPKPIAATTTASTPAITHRRAPPFSTPTTCGHLLLEPLVGYGTGNRVAVSPHVTRGTTTSAAAVPTPGREPRTASANSSRSDGVRR